MSQASAIANDSPTSCDFRSPTLRSAPITQAWVKPFMMLVGRLLEESQAPML